MADGIIGTLLSAGFLYLIALLNLIVLAGIVKVFRGMPAGAYDEQQLETQLQARGLMYRFFGRLAVDQPHPGSSTSSAWSSASASTPPPRSCCSRPRPMPPSRFVLVWAAALIYWRLGNVEDRWSSGVAAGPPEAPGA